MTPTRAKIVTGLGLFLIVLVVTCLVQTHIATANGGDIIRIHGEGLRLSVDGEPVYFRAGDYVRAPGGLRRLPFYWVQSYWYLTIPVPLALAAFGFYRMRSRPRGDEDGERKPRITIYYRTDR